MYSLTHEMKKNRIKQILVFVRRLKLLAIIYKIKLSSSLEKRDKKTKYFIDSVKKFGRTFLGRSHTYTTLL